MASTDIEAGTFYLEKLSVAGESEDEYEYEEVPVDDLSSLATGDLAEDWEKTINIIDQSKRDRKIEAKFDNPNQPSIIKRPEVADDFVRNFLRRNGLKRTMDCFQVEWYELKQKGQLDNIEVFNVPDAFQSLMLLTDEVKKLKVDRDKYKSAATAAKESYVKVMKERDFHRMHHLRIVQEKNRLITDLKRLKKHYKSFEPAMTALKMKYDNALREKMLVRLERDRAVGQVTSLQASLHNIENGKDDPLPATTGYRAERARNVEGPTQIELRKQRDKEKVQEAEKQLETKDSVFPVDTRVNPLLALVKGAPKINMRQHGNIKASYKAVSSVSLHPRKQLVVSGSDDGMWKMWPLPTGDVILTGKGHTDWISDVDFDPSGTMLASCGGDQKVKLWDFDQGKCILTFHEHIQPIWRVSWHHTSNFVASASMDQTVKVWDINSERCRATLRGHADSVNSVQFLHFGNTLLTSSADKTISLWDARTKLCAHTFFGHEHSINDANFTMKGDAVVSCDSFGTVKMWDVRTITQMLSFDVGPHPANSVAIDPTNHMMAAASNDASIKIIEISNGNISTLPGHDDACNCVMFDVTGSFLISGGSDGNIKLWS